MVGVPGKSKGCGTCRRRKKGCDQRRPSCGQCINSGYVCGGYQRDLSFVIHPASKQAAKAYFLPRTAGRELFSSITSLERTAIGTQCRALFWDVYLPRGEVEAVEMLSKCKQPTDWTEILLELSPEEPALELAFSALSVSHVGRRNSDMNLVKASTTIYGQALRDLKKALDDSTRSHSKEVLAACSLLGLYEVFEGGSHLSKSVGWISHVQGAAHIIEARGPEKHVNHHAHQLFIGSRLSIIYSAILRRKRTFLESKDWQKIPWRDCTKTYFDVLIDHVAKIPALLQTHDELCSQVQNPVTRTALSGLLEQCYKHRNVLVQWEQSKKEASRPRLTNHQRGAAILHPYPFAKEMTWENHIYMNASLVYWVAQYVINTTIANTEIMLARINLPESQLRHASTLAQQQAREFATYIVQSIPFALQPDMQASGINYITFPLCLAFGFFIGMGDQQISAWLVHICERKRIQGTPAPPPYTLTASMLHSSPSGLDFSAVNDTDCSVFSMRSSKIQSPVLDISSERNSPTRGLEIPRTFVHEHPARFYIDLSDKPG